METSVLMDFRRQERVVFKPAPASEDVHSFSPQTFMDAYHVPGSELGGIGHRVEKTHSCGRKTGEQVGRELLKDEVSQQWPPVGTY